MAARSAWRGAITFGGFPIHVATYNLLASKAGEGFKSLCPCHQLPIKQVKTCPTTGDPIDQGDLLKGVEVARGDVRHVPNEAVEQINEAEGTKAADILGLPTRDTVPVHVATGHFRVTPDEKIPGSEQGVQILWNGLRESNRCLVTEVVMRAGSKPVLLAIEADGHGLTAHALPFTTQINNTPEFKPEVDADKASVFAQFATVAGISTDDFHHNEFVDRSKEKRDALVEQALKGEKIVVPDAPTSTAGPTDIMAAMQAALDAAKPAPKAKAKPRAKAKA